jgi:hypothetical protein
MPFRENRYCQPYAVTRFHRLFCAGLLWLIAQSEKCDQGYGRDEAHRPDGQARSSPRSMDVNLP